MNTPELPPKITLRNWFAGQALIGALASETQEWHYQTPASVANYAFEVADEMMIRSQQPPCTTSSTPPSASPS